MEECHFNVPFNLMEYFERYHKHFLEYNETRTLDQTISILLRYAIGDTKKISLDEMVIIEEFFDRSEHIFGELLQWVLITLQTEKTLRNSLMPQMDSSTPLNFDG